MRIERLSLDFFGHFTGKVFDFGKAGSGSDFHLIYGSNEAGKTTTMEAYLRLLYGFPHQEPYGFKHQRQNLRVYGLLNVDGETRPFTRLSSRSGNLRGAADATLPESAIASHLGGLSLQDYRNMLCLDDVTIEKGGEDIANAQGDIGRLLFSAAAGVADLNAVLEQARAEANGLYRKRASTTRVAELKRKLGEVESAIRGLDVTAHSWRKLKDALQAARDEEARARAARNELFAKQSNVAALRRALPKLSKLGQLLEDIAAYSHYPRRIDINPEDLVTMKTKRGDADSESQRVKFKLGEAEKRRAELVLDEERLALAEWLDGLDELRSRTQTAQLDLPRRTRALEEAEADMRRIALDLGAHEGCETLGLVTSPEEISALEDLREKMRDANRARDAGKNEISRHAVPLAEARKVLRSMRDDPPARTGLIDLLLRFDAEALVPAVATATQAIASADGVVLEALNALAVGTCQFTILPACSADPSAASKLAERHADLIVKISRADDKLEQSEEDIATLMARMTAISAGAGVVSDQEAREAQARRDELWQAHREFLSAESADRFAVGMKRVDEIGATRLDHATELGELRKLEQDLAGADARAKTTKIQRERLANQAREIEGQAEILTKSIGLPTLSPSTFSDWVVRYTKANADMRRREMLSDQYQHTLERAERMRQELAPLVPLDNPTFDEALSEARRLATVEGDYVKKVRAAAEKLAEHETELERRRGEQVELEQAAEHASAVWDSKVHDLFGEALASHRLATSLGQLRDLREHDVKRQQAERQVSTMQDDTQRFSKAMGELSLRFGIDESNPLETFRRLREVADQAQADKILDEKLCEELLAGPKRSAELSAAIEDIDRTVADLGAVFPETVDTGTLDALRRAVSTAHDVIVRRDQIADLERQILVELSVRDIDEARAQIGDETVSALEANAQSLASDLEPAEVRLSAATVARANAERDLLDVTGSAEVAELVERRATLQIQIEEAILNYLQWDFGLRTAEEAIRRYRDRHRSEMMASTERAFAQLTKGAYKKLLTQPDGSSEVLVAVDLNGTPKQIGEMSKGTRFQLYLALRVAAYEQMVAQGVQLPFFCDDVFETFDEDRTRAACRLMERIGRSGQAIYLTHHRHVVEIAKEVCDAHPTIHEI